MAPRKSSKRGSRKSSGGSRRKLSDWQKFVKDNAGSGKSLKELSEEYKAKGPMTTARRTAAARRISNARRVALARRISGGRRSSTARAVSTARKASRRASAVRKLSNWQQFVKDNAGSGKSLKELSKEYKTSGMTTARRTSRKATARRTSARKTSRKASKESLGKNEAYCVTCKEKRKMLKPQYVKKTTGNRTTYLMKGKDAAGHNMAKIISKADYEANK